MKYCLKMWLPPPAVTHRPVCTVNCELLINSANSVYYVPGTFPGPGNDVSKKYMTAALSVFTFP